MNCAEEDSDDINYDAEHYSFRIRQASQRASQPPKSLINALMNSGTNPRSAAHPENPVSNTTASSNNPSCTGGMSSSHNQISLSSSGPGGLLHGKTNATSGSGPISLGQVVSTTTVAAAAAVLTRSSTSHTSQLGQVGGRMGSQSPWQQKDSVDGGTLGKSSTMDESDTARGGGKPLKKQRHVLSRSNSSLEDKDRPTAGYLSHCREYGSTSSIDVLGKEDRVRAEKGRMMALGHSTIRSREASASVGKNPRNRPATRGVQFDVKADRSDPVSKVKESSLGFLKRFRKSSGGSGSSHHQSSSGSISYSGSASTPGNLAALGSSGSSGGLTVNELSSGGSEVSPFAVSVQLPGGVRVSKAFVHYDCQSVGWELPTDYCNTTSSSIASSGHFTPGTHSEGLIATSSEVDDSVGGGGLAGCIRARDNHQSQRGQAGCGNFVRTNKRHTGASAASIRLRPTAGGSAGKENGEVDDPGSSSDIDCGDGSTNALVQSCPYFRNELGGELLRIPSMTRLTAPGSGLFSPTTSRAEGQSSPKQPPPWVNRLTPSCNSVGLLELGASDSLNGAILNGSVPALDLDSGIYRFEYMDPGNTYYRCFFAKHDDHQNWFGLDDCYGPIAVSLRRERVFDDLSNVSVAGKDKGESETFGGSSSGHGVAMGFQWRIIIRSKELNTLRGTVLEDLVPCTSRFSASRGVPVKDVLQFVAPELPLGCLRLGTSETKTHETLMKFDEQALNRGYKIGVLLCKAGQATEEEMYNNEHSSPALDDFLELIGQKVVLQNFDKYKGGLDTRTDMTGTHSYYTSWKGAEVMFHVSTLLPYTPNNTQQLMRKRHIGNDIVTIIFQEPGALSFSPQTVRSQFQHVFILVRVHSPCTQNTSYSVAVSRSFDVPAFGPPVPANQMFRRTKDFVDFLICKAINAENAAHRSNKFLLMQRRTREDYLKELATNHVTNTTLDTKSSKFFLGSGRRKDKHRPRPDLTIQAPGALVWQVEVTDYSLGCDVACALAIGWDTMVVMEETTRLSVFSLPTRSVIGWTKTSDESLRIYYNEGEYLHLKHVNEDDMNEIIQRLDVLSPGRQTFDVTLDRTLACNLGFSSPSDGVLVVKSVEPGSPPARLGIREGARVVQLCGRPIVDLVGEMYEVLRAASSLVMTMIPPDASGRLRKGTEQPDVFFTNEAFTFFQQPSLNKPAVQNDSTANHSPTGDVTSNRPLAPSHNGTSHGSGAPTASSKSPPQSRSDKSVFRQPRLSPGETSRSTSQGLMTVSMSAAERRLPASQHTAALHRSRQSPPASLQSSSSGGAADGPLSTRSSGENVRPRTAEDSAPNFRENLRRLINPAYTDDDIRQKTSNSPRHPGGLSLGMHLSDLPSELSRSVPGSGMDQPGLAPIGGQSAASVGSATRTLLSPEATQADWNMLVNKASMALGDESPRNDYNELKAVQLESAPSRPSYHGQPRPVSGGANTSSPDQWQASTNSQSTSSLKTRLSEVEQRCLQLEKELTAERDLRISRDRECDVLRRENDRLRSEKEATGAQLTQFTEWFFDSVNQKV